MKKPSIPAENKQHTLNAWQQQQNNDAGDVRRAWGKWIETRECIVKMFIKLSLTFISFSDRVLKYTKDHHVSARRQERNQYKLRCRSYGLLIKRVRPYVRCLWNCVNNSGKGQTFYAGVRSLLRIAYVDSRTRQVNNLESFVSRKIMLNWKCFVVSTGDGSFTDSIFTFYRTLNSNKYKDQDHLHIMQAFRQLKKGKKLPLTYTKK